VIALIHLIQQGRTSELLAAADQDTAGDVTDVAGVMADLEDLAAQTLDLFPDPTKPEATALTAATVPADAEATGTEPAPGCPLQDRPSHEDLLIGLLRQRLRNPVTITIHIPMTTLLELDHRSGWLEGYGPITAQHTRLLVPMAGLRQLYVAQDSGLPLALDPITHPALYDDTPDGPEEQQVAQQVRDRLLAMLGRSDKDHETRWSEGPTAAWNLSSKSPRCHHAKHHGWTTHRQDQGPHAGTTTWTSPLGHTYSKPGVWTAPARLPLQVTLLAPRHQACDDTDSGSFEHPLIPEPTPVPTVEITTRWNADKPPF
jgi:hypothetical protein